MPQRYYKIYTSHLFSFIPLLINSVLIVSVVGLLLLALPMNMSLKDALENSTGLRAVVFNSYELEQKIHQMFNPTTPNSFLLLSGPTDFSTKITLNFHDAEASQDAALATQLFDLVNQTRGLYQAPVLKSDENLDVLALAHGRDMLTMGYITSRNGPEIATLGGSFLDVSPNNAVEQVVLTPFVELANRSFIETPWYRANTLSSQFHRLGVAALKTHFYGTLFVEIFSE